VARTECIFCGRSEPQVTITKEHLFSQWVDDVLTPELLGPGRSYERTTAGPDGSLLTTTWSSEVIAAIEKTLVCGGAPGRCNNGWMSGLDGQVRHLAEPMMLGQPTVLTSQDQAVVAAWAAMKSMVLEYLWGTDQRIVLPQASRTFVYRHQQAPGDIQIRIAAVESRGRSALACRRVYELRPDANAGRKLSAYASCSTLVLGCLVIQTYATSVAGPPAGRQPHGRSYLILNPAAGSSISWPPGEALDDETLDQFAHPLQPLTGD
jgi:hypothetical protein